MEIPYRSSTAESEGQRSSLVGPSGSPPTLVGTTNTSEPASPTKIPSVASAVSTLINRNRQRTPRRYVFDDRKWSLRRRSSNEVPKSEEVLLNNNPSSENANDCRVTVV
jgi:hypothetical protein